MASFIQLLTSVQGDGPVAGDTGDVLEVPAAVARVWADGERAVKVTKADREAHLLRLSGGFDPEPAPVLVPEVPAEVVDAEGAVYEPQMAAAELSLAEVIARHEQSAPFAGVGEQGPVPSIIDEGGHVRPSDGDDGAGALVP